MSAVEVLLAAFPTAEVVPGDYSFPPHCEWAHCRVEAPLPEVVGVEPGRTPTCPDCRKAVRLPAHGEQT